jgi:hypothetical protein
MWAKCTVRYTHLLSYSSRKSKNASKQTTRQRKKKLTQKGEKEREAITTNII